MKKTIKPRVKRTIKIGNDGYGCKNVTVKADRGSIYMTRTCPHSWGRIVDRMYIRKEDVRELAIFLLDQISDR